MNREEINFYLLNSQERVMCTTELIELCGEKPQASIFWKKHGESFTRFSKDAGKKIASRINEFIPKVRPIVIPNSLYDIAKTMERAVYSHPFDHYSYELDDRPLHLDINNAEMFVHCVLVTRLDEINSEIILGGYGRRISEIPLSPCLGQYITKTMEDPFLATFNRVLKNYGFIEKKTNRKFETFIPGKKSSTKINTIVYIDPIKVKQPPQEPTNNHRDYSHRFDVRGHWRDIKGWGSAPDGSLLKGRTWVRDCIKGPEDKPYVKKTRVIRELAGVA